MRTGLLRRASDECRAWVWAIRNLHDNPVAKYFLLARRRRLLNIPWWRRHALLLLALAIAAALASFEIPALMQFYSAQEQPLWIALFVSLGSLSYAVYIVWLLQGVFDAVVGSTSFLSAPGRKDHWMRIDDFTAATTVGDHELLAGGLRVLLPPLWLRVVVGGILLATTKIIGSLQAVQLTPPNSWNFPSPQELTSNWANDGLNLVESLGVLSLRLPEWQFALIQAPIESLFYIACGLLASSMLVLVFIALGVGSTAHLARIIAGALMVISQLAFAAASTGGSYSYAYSYMVSAEFVTTPKTIMAMAAIGLVPPLLLVSGLTIASRFLVLRDLMKVVLAALILSPVIVKILWIFRTYAVLSASAVATQAQLWLWMPIVSNSYLWAWGIIMPVNPSSTLLPSMWYYYMQHGMLFHWTEILRTPLLLVIQVATLPIIAHFALRAVAARRQSAT